MKKWNVDGKKMYYEIDMFALFVWRFMVKITWCNVILTIIFNNRGRFLCKKFAPSKPYELIWFKLQLIIVTERIIFYLLQFILWLLTEHRAINNFCMQQNFKYIYLPLDRQPFSNQIFFSLGFEQTNSFIRDKYLSTR